MLPQAAPIIEQTKVEMSVLTSVAETRVAVLVDCDNTSPAILAYALRMVAQFGRVVLRRGYGNHTTLSAKWQAALVEQAFTPCLQFQYASGKNTADIALALDAMEAMFDQRADMFCVITSDSDFAYLCRKLRERGASVCIVGEAKTPSALRNASDQFFEWTPEPVATLAHAAPIIIAPPQHEVPAAPPKSREGVKLRPLLVVDAVRLLVGDAPEGKIGLGALGQYLKRTDSGFSPTNFGHSGLLEMVKTYDLLTTTKEQGGHYTVKLADMRKAEPQRHT